jgi:flagellar hook assembly protein FlgD
VRISYQVESAGPLSVRIFDAKGRLVCTLEDGYRGAGTHTALWDGKTDEGILAAPGVYFVGLQSAERSLMQKFIVVR